MEVLGAYPETAMVICDYSVEASSELKAGRHLLAIPAAVEETQNWSVKDNLVHLTQEICISDTRLV